MTSNTPRTTSTATTIARTAPPATAASMCADDRTGSPAAENSHATTIKNLIKS